MGWFNKTYKKLQENMPTSFRDIAVDTLFLAGGLCSGGLLLLGTSAVVGYRMQKRIEKGQRQKFLKSGEPLPAVLKKWREKTGKEKRATLLNWMMAGAGAYFLGYANGLAALGGVILGETALRHVAMHEGIAYGKKVNSINSDKWLSAYQKQKILNSLNKKRIIPFLWMTNSGQQPKKSTVSIGIGAKPATKKIAPKSVENVKTAVPRASAKIKSQSNNSPAARIATQERQTHIDLNKLNKFLER